MFFKRYWVYSSEGLTGCFVWKLIRIRGKMLKYIYHFPELQAFRTFCLTKNQKLLPYFWSMKRIFRLSAIVIFIAACNNGPTKEDDIPQTPVITYNIASTLPHDTSSFTEGLEFYNNTLLESTGLKGKSKLLQADPSTGKAIKQLALDSQYFGEGISVLHDTLYQMTWQDHKLFIYSAKDLKKIKELPLDIEGWGMTNDGKNLIASNGGSNLYYYEPGTFRLLRTVAVTEGGTPAVNINELEFINGFIYANQWQYNYILKIDPASGKVVAKMDLSEIMNKEKTRLVGKIDDTGAYLNGIAYNPSTDKIYVTGKLWPELYEIQFAH